MLQRMRLRVHLGLPLQLPAPPQAPTAPAPVAAPAVAAPATDLPPFDPTFDVDSYVFGGKVAEDIGASLSGSRDEQGVDVIRAKQDERRRKGASETDWQSELEPLSFEERVEKTLDCLSRRQSYMNILRGLPVFCAEERSCDEIEQHVQSYAEFEANRTSPCRYVFFLRRTGALEEIELDEAGVRITDDMREAACEEGLSEEDIEDMAVDWRVGTADVGAEAVRRTDPADRLSTLIAVKESRLPRYLRVLEFCVDRPRSLAEITELLKSDPGLEINEKTGVIGMQPNAYISKLDQAGVLVWKDGWSTTEEGMRAVRDIQTQSGS